MSATFGGPGNCYRYDLKRDLGALAPGNRVLFVMLNPSTADATADDPTIRRVTAFAKREGANFLVVCNLFALRATDPRELYAHPAPEGDTENLDAIREEARLADRIICAWGAHGGLRRRDHFVLGALKSVFPFKPRLWCLGKTKGGHPRHPLYLAADAKLEAM